MLLCSLVIFVLLYNKLTIIIEKVKNQRQEADFKTGSLVLIDIALL